MNYRQTVGVQSMQLQTFSELSPWSSMIHQTGDLMRETFDFKSPEGPGW